MDGRRITGLRSAPGWFTIIVFLYRIVGHASNIDFVVSASGNSRMTAVWNFLQSTQGEVCLAVLGFGWIAVLLVLPRKDAGGIGVSSPPVLEATSDAVVPRSEYQKVFGSSTAHEQGAGIFKTLFEDEKSKNEELSLRCSEYQIQIKSLSELKTAVPLSNVKVEYKAPHDGERAKFIFKVRDGCPPVKIRRIGPLVSEEVYRLHQAIITLQSEIPEVEQRDPVECTFMAPDLIHAMELGGPNTLDSINVEYTVPGSAETRISQYFLHKNADGSIVFWTERPQLEAKSLADLRSRLILLNDAHLALSWVDLAEMLADEIGAIGDRLQACNSKAIKEYDLAAQSAFEHPLSGSLTAVHRSWYVSALIDFQDLYSGYRTRAINTMNRLKAPLLLAVGDDSATYKDVMDSIYNHQAVLKNMAHEVKSRYSRIAGTVIAEEKKP